MTVKELHDALSMAYWKGVGDFQDQFRKSPATKDQFFTLSIIDTKEFNEALNKSAEVYIDKLIVNIMSNLKLSVR